MGRVNNCHPYLLPFFWLVYSREGKFSNDLAIAGADKEIEGKNLFIITYKVLTEGSE